MSSKLLASSSNLFFLGDFRSLEGRNLLVDWFSIPYKCTQIVCGDGYHKNGWWWWLIFFIFFFEFVKVLLEFVVPDLESVQ